MKTKEQIEANLAKSGELKNAPGIGIAWMEGWIEALKWVLMDREFQKFACPQCGSDIHYHVTYTGLDIEILDAEYGDLDGVHKSERMSTHDAFYMCSDSTCGWVANEEWENWHAQEISKGPDEEETYFPILRERFSEENCPDQDTGSGDSESSPGGGEIREASRPDRPDDKASGVQPARPRPGKSTRKRNKNAGK